MKKFFLSAIFLWLAAIVFGQQALPKPGFDEALQQIAERYQTVGLAIVVVKNNQPVYSEAFGYKDRETKEKLTVNDLFRIASISKSFTATALMQLVEEDEISLEDDFGDLVGFPVRNPHFPDKKITLEMVLSHRSSINDKNGYFDLDVINPQKNKDWANSYNNVEPGTHYQYCNLNFNMAGAVLEKLTGVRFDEYIDRKILQPLHLNAGYCVDSLNKSLFVSLYEYDSGKFVKQQAAYNPRSEEIKNYVMGQSTPVFSPTGGMKISANDLAKYMLMHMNDGKYKTGRILQKKSAKKMQQKLSDKEGYGLALQEVDDLIDGVHLIGHTGSAYGLYSNMFFNPEKKYGFVVITNGCTPHRSGDYLALSKDMINLLYQHFIK